MHNIRYNIIIVFFTGLYIILGCKLIWFGMQNNSIEETLDTTKQNTIIRPDIVDRNGKLLARDIRSFSLFAQPNHIINATETVKILNKILPKLNTKATIKKLKSKQYFVWIERNLASQQKNAIKALGLPGLGFKTETHRYYVNGSDASYIVGYVNVDNRGLAGIEKYIDTHNLNATQNITDKAKLLPITLSIDMRIQSIITKVLNDAIKKYKAKAAGAIIQNVNTGEILAMNSLPNFDPLYPAQALESNKLNRMTSGLYEMGSVVKIFTTAMALNSGKFTPDTIIKIDKPLKVGPHQFIHDFHGAYKPLSVSDIFIKSSNIGSAKEAETIGLINHKKFLKKLGLLDKLNTELPELATPVQPKKWKKVNSMTIAFGHGIMFTPLHVTTSACALVNGGYLIAPTFLKAQNRYNKISKHNIITQKTSQQLIKLLGLNMTKGSGHFANEKYYNIGGKTGTAEKVENGKYTKDKNFNNFLAVIPLKKPQYVVLTVIDTPQKANEYEGKTAGFNAAPMAVEIINRCSNFLGIHPEM